jgi:tetratricopeptide (TPR) repeat protein
MLATPPARAALDDSARAEIHHQRGARALRAGNQEEAIEWFDKALALQPDRVESMALKARALLEAGRAAEAEAVTEQIRALKPGDVDVAFLLALTAYRQQDWISAQRYLEEARDATPRDPKIRLYLGRTYQELGRDTDAERELLAAGELDPAFRAPAAYRLGILHLQRGETKQAKARFEEARDLDPDSELADSAEVYLKLMAATEPRRLTYWAKLGMAWDSNLTLAGGGDLVEASDEPGWRSSLEIGLNARLFTWKGFTMRVGATNYVSYHIDTPFHEFDIQQIRPWALFTWQPSEYLAFDTRFTHERVYRNWNSFKTANFVSPAVRILPRPGWVTRMFVEYEDRNYNDAFEAIRSRDRDGQVGIAGLDQYIPLPNPFTDGLAYFRFGWRFRNEDSGGAHFDSQSHKPLATLAVDLPWGMNLSLDASYERREFRERSIFEVTREILSQLPGPDDFGTLALAGVANQPFDCVFVPPDTAASPDVPEIENLNGCRTNDRLDKITQARVRLRKTIGRSWILETYYRWVDWSSNTEEFDFNRHIVGLAATFRR